MHPREHADGGFDSYRQCAGYETAAITNARCCVAAADAARTSLHSVATASFLALIEDIVQAYTIKSTGMQPMSVIDMV